MPINTSSPTPPPSRSRRATSAAGPEIPQGMSPETRKRADGLVGIMQLVQAGCLMFGQYADAATIGMHGPRIAPEAAKVAETTEWLAKPIDFLIEIGPFGGLIAALLPLGLQLAANHRMIDANRVIGSDIVPPEVLEAQMKAQVLRAQAEAAKQQQMAMQEAQSAQREFEEMMRANAT